MSATTSNARLQKWVSDWAAILEPTDIYWCDGSAQEYERLCGELVSAGTFTKLDEAKRPNSYWAHSDPGDVARVKTVHIFVPPKKKTLAPQITGANQQRCVPN